MVTLVFYLASYNCFLLIPKVTGGTFFGFVFGFVFTRFGPVLMVVCCSAGGWFGHLGCALWVSLW